MDVRLQDLVDISALTRMLDGMGGFAALSYCLRGLDGAVIAESEDRAYKKPGSETRGISADVAAGGWKLAELTLYPAGAKPADDAQKERLSGFAHGTAELLGAAAQGRLMELRAEQNELLADSISEAVARTDASGTYLYVSPSAQRLTGYTPDELVGRKREDFVHPADVAQVGRLTLGFMLHRKPLSATYRFIRKDGSVFWMETKASPSFDAFGDLVEVRSVARDVTDRVQAEAALQQAKEQMHVMLRGIDAAILQFDRAGVVTMAEGRGLAKFDPALLPLEGKLFTAVYEGSEAVISAVRQALSGKRASAELAWGGYILEETFAPCYDAESRLVGAIGLVLDVTERRLAEQKLNAEKERLRVTLQSIGDGVIATDREGRVTVMNGVAEALTGWPAQTAIGRPFAEVFDIYDETTGEAARDPVERVLSTGNVVGLGNHTLLRAVGGAEHAIADSAAPILDESRATLGAVLVFRDVTEAKKRESEITYLSYHDSLTGVYNRAFFDEEARRLDTGRQLPISVIMGDVNGLKLTNDVFGHAEGDNLLVRIAGILRECCRNEDIVARMGGDEFCILLPRTPYASASDICRRIYAHCEKVEYGLPSGSARLSISLGFATKTEPDQTIAAVTKAAEDLMYRRKLMESRSQHSFLIASIRTTLFEKSFEPEQHAQRLIANSRAIGKALNLPEDQLADLELFALLHDIGKIAIDGRILMKPEPLDDADRGEIRRHPEIGLRIAQASPDLAHIAEYILCHHERWDGSGYPQGLKGTAIPLLSRIFSVVDAYDAMTQDRPYRKAMTKEEACTELQKCAGTQFDPNIVWVFLEILEHEYYIA